jgi:bifunctional enzyme CysN/CysC
MRQGLSRDLGFSADDRSENLRRSAEVAKILNDAGLICIAAFVAPHDAVRQRAREVIGTDRFIEIHCTAPMDVLRQRDKTGSYTKADTGEISAFPGVSATFEEPANADLVLKTDQTSVEECVDRIVALLTSRGVIE